MTNLSTKGFYKTKQNKIYLYSYSPYYDQNNPLQFGSVSFHGKEIEYKKNTIFFEGKKLKKQSDES